MLNRQDFIQKEIVEVNEMVGGMSTGLCRLDADEDDMRIEYFYYLNISNYII